MTHLSEERNIPTGPEAVWALVSDTRQWPRFFATTSEFLHLRSVEYLEGAREDGPGVARRLHFLGVPSWDERIIRWKPGELVVWQGVRNPWQRSWQQGMELIPGRGFTTLRWDVYYDLSLPRPLRKEFKKRMEGIMVSSLARIENLVLPR